MLLIALTKCNRILLVYSMFNYFCLLRLSEAFSKFAKVMSISKLHSVYFPVSCIVKLAFVVIHFLKLICSSPSKLFVMSFSLDFDSWSKPYKHFLADLFLYRFHSLLYSLSQKEESLWHSVSSLKFYSISNTC